MAEADALIAAYERDGLDASYMIDQPGTYGCNMIIRVAALPGARCDENLPLYGWLEDLDYSARFTKVGRVVETSLCVGVHLGVKSGRSSGLQLGYSQIANPLYIAGKGSISWRRAVSMAARVDRRQCDPIARAGALYRPAGTACRQFAGDRRSPGRPDSSDARSRSRDYAGGRAPKGPILEPRDEQAAQAADIERQDA